MALQTPLLRFLVWGAKGGGLFGSGGCFLSMVLFCGCVRLGEGAGATANQPKKRRRYQNCCKWMEQKESASFRRVCPNKGTRVLRGGSSVNRMESRKGCNVEERKTEAPLTVGCMKELVYVFLGITSPHLLRAKIKPSKNNCQQKMCRK